MARTFKPGLNYTVLGKIAPILLPTALKVELTVTHSLQPVPTTTTEMSPIEMGLIQGSIEQPALNFKQLGPVFLDVDADGNFRYDMTIPENVESALFGDSTAFTSLRQSNSPSDSFIQVSLDPSGIPRSGSVSTFEIETTERIPKVYYQVLSKGEIVASGEVNMQFSRVKRFPLPITTEMTPEASLSVYYVREDGEVVTDATSFIVNGIFKNKVDINSDVQETRPGKEVVVSVKADPDSTVHLLAVDKSVLIERSDNDLNESRVIDELYSYLGRSAKNRRRPKLSRGRDAYSVFRNNQMAVLSDALVYEGSRKHFTRPIFPRNSRRFSDTAQTVVFPIMKENIDRVSSSVGPELNYHSSLPRVRKFFPETWLWSNFSTGANGRASLRVTVPDSITTWVVTAFVVNSKSGLGLHANPVNIKVFKPLFVSLTMPFSVTRGELVVLQANVFNYLERDVRVLVIINKNESFKNLVTYIQDNQVKKGRFSAKVGRTFNMSAGEIYPVYFPIIPTETGDLLINITVISTGPSDAVIRYLKVEPEGMEKEINNTVLINTVNTGTFSKDVEISFPQNTVAGSRRIRTSIIGNVIGSSLNGLDWRRKSPGETGEENMVNFAPSIFVQKYLKTTNKLTADLEKKEKETMIKSYEKELTYLHDDGSFSAFGKSDKSGSTWLTAFVVKSFSHASDFIFIDENVVKKAVTWLVSQQREIGTFREPGRVLLKEIQGGSAKSERALTAFTLIALKEAEVIQGVSALTGRAIQKARAYLEGDIDLMEDVYELALVGYTLQITNSPRVNKVFSKLNTKATFKDGLKYWSKPETGIQWKGWPPPNYQAKAVDIETTAYALLGFAINKDIDPPVLKWVISQRNSRGEFVSTQDTVIALQGFLELASLVHNPNFNMSVRLTSKTPSAPYQRVITITKDNILFLQTLDIPEDVRRLDVTANGTGIALMEISSYFNTDEKIEVSSFDVNVTLTDETTRGFTVKVCGRWLEEGYSGMSLMDIGIPSGMTPDLDTLDTSKAPMYKRNEMGYRKLSLYFDEFDRQDQCASVYMVNTDKVAEKQPSVIRLYDYYEPKNQATIFYTSNVMADSGVCDVCGMECFCAD
ncbi:CD109 antigen-like [Saccostrea echinata]|uniref:CD109 antigen-like n=1 Tax=Saccostrea echinata TaxID=191078 RepID=UPI002A80CB6B|nr:CD109 antigen-like [Saccostrea echinata]